MPEEIKSLKIRRWRKKDIPAILSCQKAAYPDYTGDTLCDERLYQLQFQAFPEGQFLAELDGKVVGYATSLIVDLEEEDKRYLYAEITGTGTFSTHDPSGETLFGADIAVHPKYRGKGVAEKLYKRRRKLVTQLNLRRMVAYGRLPGYSKVAGTLSPDKYVEEVQSGARKDPALLAHLRAGYTVKGLLLDFMGDQSSLNHATFLEWLNPRYDRLKRRAASAPLRRVNRKVRVCAAQFMLNRIVNFEEFRQNCEFFAESASVYHCHFLLLPEYFTTQLFHTYPDRLSEKELVTRLAGESEKVRELLVELASEYQLYIVAGSTPEERDGKLYNVSYLVTPSGNIYSQDKIHITPAERGEWNITPGEQLRIFDTPLGRVAIQICYDIEFPETSRLLALAGAEIVFVPFNTDEQVSFLRVHSCAQARAVENYMYVVTSALVGNLPTIRKYLINYGRSAVYTPSDVAFPVGAVLGMADPNVETVVTCELDLETLALQREIGSVLPFFDRRADFYTLESKVPIEIVRVD